MKNLFTTTLLLMFATGSFAQLGQLVNGGFENWTDQNLYDYPTDWSNSNLEEYQGVAALFQSTDAQDGTYSCRLSVETAGAQDTLIGYVYQGLIGQFGPTNGIPYTANFDEMQYHYKCDLMPGDTLFVLVTRFIAGTPVGTQALPLATGTESNWTAGSVSFTNGAQDEIFIGFTIGNPIANVIPTPGSWVQIDNISMHNAGIAVANLPDPSFENWAAVTTENPDNWDSFNFLLAGFGAENVVKSTDANSGSFALEMATSQPIPGGDTVNAYLSYGTIDLYAQNPFVPEPYDAIPTEFTGAYKYTPVSTDQAFIQLLFYQNGSVIGAEALTIDAQATYLNFSLPLSISTTPDSMAIIVYAGDNPGSTLLLDDLAFAGGNVGLSEFSSMNVDIYPNPATNSVMIKADGSYNYTLTDLSGSTVMNGENVNGAIQLDVNQLSSGAYFVTLTNEFKTESHKLIIE